jgi:hypothetical protein
MVLGTSKVVDSRRELMISLELSFKRLEFGFIGNVTSSFRVLEGSENAELNCSRSISGNCTKIEELDSNSPLLG